MSLGRLTFVLFLLASPSYAQGNFPTSGFPACTTVINGRIAWDIDLKVWKVCTTGTWTQAPSGGGLNSGDIVFRLSACPTGFTEVTALNGSFVLGTTNAAGNVGTTGGQDTITTVLNHTHPVTDPTHNHTQNSHNHTQNSFAPRIINSGTAGTVGVQGASAASNANASNAATTATNQAATATNIAAATGVTTNNPVGGVASIDNRPAFIRLIACSKD